MATRQFFHCIIGLGTEKTPGVHHGAQRNNLDFTATGYVPWALNSSQGVIAGGQPFTTNTITGPTNGVEFSTGTSGPAEWVSLPFDGAYTISGTVTCNIWAGESAMTANAAVNVVCELLDAELNVIATIFTTNRTTELGTSVVANNFTVTPTSTTTHLGDRLRVRIFAKDGGGTMASGNVINYRIDTTTPGGSGDSWIEFTETLGFITADPAGTQIFLTDATASGVTAGTALKKEAWTARGSGTTTAVTTSPGNGWVAPKQITKTSGGTEIEWYTRPLAAFTLSGAVKMQLRNMQHGAGSSGTVTAVRAEIAVCDGDGSNPTVWAAAGLIDQDTAIGGSIGAGTASNGQLTYNAGQSIQAYLAGDNVAVADGQRIRFRLYVDDPSNTPAVLGAGWQTFLDYAASSVNTGDTWLTFDQTLTEFVSGTAGLATVGVRLSAGGARPDVPAAANLEAGVIAKAGALAEFSRSSLAVLGVVTPTGATRDYSSSAFGAIGLISRSQGALFEPTVTNGRSITGIAPLAGGANPAPNAVTLAAVGLLARAGAARPEPNSSSNLEVGVLALSSSARPDVLAAALAELGVTLRAMPTTTDVVSSAYAALGITALAGTSRPDITAAGNLEAGVLTLAGTSRPEPSSSSRTLAGVALLAGTSRADISAPSVAEVGVLLRALPVISDVVSSAYAVLGAALIAGGGRPDIPATVVSKVGAALTAGTARPDAIAAALAELGVATAAGTSRPEPSAAARALLGIVSTSMPSVTGDLSVVGLVMLGIATRSSGNTVDISSSGRALLGAVPRSGGALFEPGLSIGRAFLGAVLLGGGALPAVSSSSVALAGVIARAGGATPNVIATAAAIVGAAARGVPVMTVSAAAVARLGLVTRSVPTVTITAGGRVVVGVVTYVEAIGGQLVIVLPREWSRYKEPAATTFREAAASRWRDPSAVGG